MPKQGMNSLGGMIMAGTAGWMLYKHGWMEIEPWFLLTVGLTIMMYANNSRQQAGTIGKFALLFFFLAYAFGFGSFDEILSIFKQT